MKQTDKSGRPDCLRVFDEPDKLGTWSNFKGLYQVEFKKLQETLFSDQRGLCAYCEIDLIFRPAVGMPDFRVEHFHPQSDTSRNWRYDWNNLFATCGGGSVTPLAGVAAERYTAPDLSCDAIKANKILDEVVFNPLDGDLSQSLFEFDEQGHMRVASSCPEELVEKAASTISELNLSATDGGLNRLDRLRAGVISKLREQVMVSTDVGVDVPEALGEIAEALFPDDHEQQWPAFFSCVRWYLGPAAESRLAEIAK